MKWVEKKIERFNNTVVGDYINTIRTTFDFTFYLDHAYA